MNMKKKELLNVYYRNQHPEIIWLKYPYRKPIQSSKLIRIKSSDLRIKKIKERSASYHRFKVQLAYDKYYNMESC